MLAKASKGLPVGDFLYEPKWDGLRCLVFRDGTTIELLGRNEKSLTKFFPDVVTSLLEQLPQKCVLDGELLVAAVVAIPVGDGLPPPPPPPLPVSPSRVP